MYEDLFALEVYMAVHQWLNEKWCDTTEDRMTVFESVYDHHLLRLSDFSSAIE